MDKIVLFILEGLKVEPLAEAGLLAACKELGKI
jgi:hypothetical protein